MNNPTTTRPVTGLPKNLTQLAAEIHADNIRAGWWQVIDGVTQERNIGELLCLVHSEISEAQDYGMDEKLPHRPAVEVELGDAVIRILDLLGFYEECLIVSFEDEVHGVDTVAELHRFVSFAMEEFRKGRTDIGCYRLIILLGEIESYALRNELDLTGAIAEKRAYNSKRADHKPENRAKEGGKKF